jgi:hypothetical protein
LEPTTTITVHGSEMMITTTRRDWLLTAESAVDARRWQSALQCRIPGGQAGPPRLPLRPAPSPPRALSFPPPPPLVLGLRESVCEYACPFVCAQMHCKCFRKPRKRLLTKEWSPA